MTSNLPYEIREALVQCCGRVFWYRDSYKSFLLAAGVPRAMYDRHGDQNKYKIAHLILGELDALGDEGFLMQRRLVTEFCKLRGAPAESQDRAAALTALARLEELAVSQKLYNEKEVVNESEKRLNAEEEHRRTMERNTQLEVLNSRFCALVGATSDEQKRGYALESILSDLFSLANVPYRRSYKTQTEQIDGHFSFKGFDYLVEVRWRKEYPTEGDLATLKLKVDKKITSTRGLFVSFAGFRRSVVEEFTRGVASNIILMDGADLALILEGRVSLVQALELKIEKAAQEGSINVHLRELI
jgi:hypothetical protein